MDEKGDNVLFVEARHVDFPPSVSKAGQKQDRNRLGKNMANISNTVKFSFFEVDSNIISCYSLHWHFRFRVMLCHLIVWKVVLTHVRSGQLYLVEVNIGQVGQNIGSWVQNIDSAQLAEWGDEGSFEAQWLNWRGIPKIPILLNLLYCPRLAGWMMVASRGAHCSAKNCMKHIESTTYRFLFFERSTASSGG